MKYINDISEATYGVFEDNRGHVFLGNLSSYPLGTWELSKYSKWLDEVSYGFINLHDLSSIPVMLKHKNIVNFYTIGQSISKLLFKHFSVLLKDDVFINKCAEDKNYLKEQVYTRYLSTSIFNKIYDNVYFKFNFWKFLNMLANNIKSFEGVTGVMDEYITYLAFNKKLSDIEGKYFNNVKEN